MAEGIRTNPADPTVVVASRTVEIVAPASPISWRAIFAGVAVLIASQLVLSLIGVGFGLSAVDPLAGETPSAKTFSIAGGLWWALSSWISLFIGGWVAGHLAGLQRETDAAIHGLVTWGLSSILALFVAGSLLSAVASGAKGLVGTAAVGAAAGASKLGVAWPDIKREARMLPSQNQNAAAAAGMPATAEGTPPTTPTTGESQAGLPDQGGMNAGRRGGPYRAQMNEDFDTSLDYLLSRGKDATAADRDTVINALAARTGMSREEAARRVQAWEQKAREAADATAKALSRAAIWGAIALLLGGIAAAIGGIVGRPERVVV